MQKEFTNLLVTSRKSQKFRLLHRISNSGKKTDNETDELHPTQRELSEAGGHCICHLTEAIYY